MLNSHQIIGRLGGDPEVRTLDNGTKVASFTVATTFYYKDQQGQKQTKTDWHSVVAWSKRAEVAEKYLKKGDLVHVEGRSTTEKYENNGETKYYTKLIVNNFLMLGSPKNSGEQSSQSPASTPSYETPTAEDSNEIDDLPF